MANWPFKLSKLLRRVGADERGVAAVLFSLVFMTLLLSVGVGMDFSRAFSVQRSLQADLDAAILAGATQDTISELSAEDIAKVYFGDNWQAKHKAGQVALEFKTEDNTFTAIANVDVPTSIMKLSGVDVMSVSAKAKLAFGGRDVEIALVLDSTGSMNGQKLEDLKVAAEQLITAAFDFENAADHVKVALVPFSDYVNVGMSHRNASWIDVPNDNSSTQEVCGQVTPITAQTNCRMETYTYTSDGTPMTGQQQVCDYEYGPPENQCNDVTTSNVWMGCVGSRTYPLNVQDENYSVRVPGIMNNYCPKEILPLTSDKSAAITNVQSMWASGETYVPGGLAWGWRVLSKSQPFEEAQPTNLKKVRKMLVLMSDGANTLSPTYPRHDGYDVTKADELTLELCENIKNDGIEVFTVAFDIYENSVLEKMKTCASDLGKFFETTSGEQLKTAFKKIGQSTRVISLTE